MRCLQCDFETSNPKFCSRSCAASYNNAKYPKRGKLSEHPCSVCNFPTKNSIYCSYACHKQAQYEQYISDWKSGVVSGGSASGVSSYVVRYLRETRGDYCERCSWAEVNPITQRIPLQVHHVAHYLDHSESKLQLLCPNCHSLTSTFGALNKGNGRTYRRQSIAGNVPDS